jgi:hypothetical protein
MSCGPLTAAELAYMQSVQEEFLPDTCTIRRRTVVDDGYGGTEYTNVDREDVPCRAWNTETRAADGVADAERNVYPYTFTFAYGTDIVLEDLILYQGHTLAIRRINTPDSWTTAVRIGAEEVD